MKVKEKSQKCGNDSFKRHMPLCAWKLTKVHDNSLEILISRRTTKKNENEEMQKGSGQEIVRNSI